MQCGCPVVASNVSSIPEVAADAAILVDPYDVGAIADAMCTVLTDSQARERLIAAGFRQATLFSWRRCAETMLSVIRTKRAGYPSISRGCP
jgi:glycosyltransferase involved in cell wall biosynthesis